MPPWSVVILFAGWLFVILVIAGLALRGMP